MLRLSKIEQAGPSLLWELVGLHFLWLLSCLVLYTPRDGRTLPAGEGGCAAGSLPPSRHYLNQTWTCCAVQIVTRVPLSLYLGPRLVNVVSLRKRPNSLYLQRAYI